MKNSSFVFLAILVIVTGVTLSLFGQRKSEKIVNNSFANMPFGKNSSMEWFLEKYKHTAGVQRKPYKSSLSETVDSVYSINIFESKLDFYKSKAMTFLISAHIVNSEILMARSVKIGMSKNDFFKAMGEKREFKCDTVVVTDDANYSEHTFLFKSGKLVQADLRPGFN